MACCFKSFYIFIQDIVLRLHTNPKRIFGLADQPDTYIEVEIGSEWTIPDSMRYTKSKWTPFAGMKVYGSVKRVFLRGQIAMVDGKVCEPLSYIRAGTLPPAGFWGLEAEARPSSLRSSSAD